MNKTEFITNDIVQGNNMDGTLSQQVLIRLKGRIVSISYTCDEDSDNVVFVGWNEDASAKETISQGKSVPKSAQPGNYLDGNDLYIDFGTDVTPATKGSAVFNKCLIKITREKDEFCPND